MSERLDGSPTPPPIPIRIWLIAAVTGTGAFMAMLDSTVANLAVESVRADFGSTLSLAQWIATGYLIALAVSLPAVGWLGRRYGYGPLWAASLAGFVAASMACALAPGPLALVGARFAQGLAGGLMVPAGQAVIGAAAGPKQLGRLMGALGLVVALGPAVGPAVGGFLLEVGSWRWLFWINVPIGIAALAAARGLVPKGPAHAHRPLDVRGLLLLGLGLPLLLWGGTEIGSAGATIVTVLAVGLGLALAGIFVVTAVRAEHPLVDMRLLRRGTVAAATATAGLTGANMYGGLLLVPLYLQLAAERDVTETGLMLLVMGMGSAAALPAAGTLTDRYGAGAVALGGAGMLIAATLPFVMAAIPPTTTLALILAARGVGVAVAQMPAMAAAYASVTRDEMGDAATLINIVQRVGGALGAIAVVIIIARTGGSTSADAYRWAFAALAAVSALTVVSATFLRKAQPRDSDIRD